MSFETNILSAFGSSFLECVLGERPSEPQIRTFTQVAKRANHEHAVPADIVIPLRAHKWRNVISSSSIFGQFLTNCTDENLKLVQSSLTSCKYPLSKIWKTKDLLCINLQRHKIIKSLIHQMRAAGVKYGASKFMENTVVNFHANFVLKEAKPRDRCQINKLRGLKLLIHLIRMVAFSNGTIKLQEKGHREDTYTKVTKDYYEWKTENKEERQPCEAAKDQDILAQDENSEQQTSNATSVKSELTDFATGEKYGLTNMVISEQLGLTDEIVSENFLPTDVVRGSPELCPQRKVKEGGLGKNLEPEQTIKDYSRQKMNTSSYDDSIRELTRFLSESQALTWQRPPKLVSEVHEFVEGALEVQKKTEYLLFLEQDLKDESRNDVQNYEDQCDGNNGLEKVNLVVKEENLSGECCPRDKNNTLHFVIMEDSAGRETIPGSYQYKPIVNMKTGKQWNGFAEDYCKILEVELRRAVELKHGVAGCLEWKTLLQEQAWQCMTLQMLSVSHSNCVKVEIDSYTQNTKEWAFVLYNYARLSMIFKSFEEYVRKGQVSPLPSPDDLDFSLLRQDEEWNLVWVYILRWPEIVEEITLDILNGSGKVKTAAVTRFLHSFAHRFSAYYSRYHILVAKPLPHLMPLMYARLHLLQAVYNVMTICFSVLGIDSPPTFM
nr:uncharacterized protein LOC123758813 [Procambarus clarkii]